MAKIDFEYDYPYTYYDDEAGRFTNYWSETRKTLNGCYTYPMLFHEPIMCCKKIMVSVEIEDVVGSRVLGRPWDFYIWKTNNTWVEMMTFAMPESGMTQFVCDMKGYDIKGFAMVPTSNPGSGSSWSMYYVVEQLRISENVDLNYSETGKFQYGVFVNRYGLKQQLNEVYVNIDGALVQATDILVNKGNGLVSLPSVHHGYVKTESECITVFAFTPDITANYTIKTQNLSQRHDLHLYTADFTKINSGYFTNKSFELTAGTLYYIVAFHPCYQVGTCESYIQIYKEA